MGRNRQWLDVSLRNAALLLVAAERMGLDRAALVAQLPHGVPTDTRGLSKAWSSLADFNRLVDAFVAQAGHPAHLVECGLHIAAIEFGSEAFKRFLLFGPVRYLTTPGMAVREIVSTAPRWTTNKRFEAVLGGRERGREVFKLSYIRGPNGETPREPSSDILSVLYWIRGIWEQVAPQWAGQPDPGWVHVVRSECDVLSALDVVLPGSRRELEDGVLTVDGAAVGRVVWLLPDPETGEYLGEFEDLPPDARSASGATPGVRIERTLHTVSTRTRESLPLLREGELYSHPDHPLPGTLVELRWRTSWFQRWFQSLFAGHRRRFTEQIAAEVEHAASEQQVATYERRLELADEYLRRRFPTQRIAREVLEGQYEPQRLQTCVLLLDVVKFTVKSWQLQSHEMAEKIRRFSARMIAICEREGGWFYKFTGDGGIFIWTDWSGEGGPGAERRAAAAALRGAREMLRIAGSEFGWELRIGLHAGEVTWYVLEEGFSFEGTGKGIDLAARMEKGARDGALCASDDLVSLLEAPEGLDGPVSVTIKHGGEVATWHAAV